MTGDFRRGNQLDFPERRKNEIEIAILREHRGRTYWREGDTGQRTFPLYYVFGSTYTVTCLCVTRSRIADYFPRLYRFAFISDFFFARGCVSTFRRRRKANSARNKRASQNRVEDEFGKIPGERDKGIAVFPPSAIKIMAEERDSLTSQSPLGHGVTAGEREREIVSVLV